MTNIEEKLIPSLAKFCFPRKSSVSQIHGLFSCVNWFCTLGQHIPKRERERGGEREGEGGRQAGRKKEKLETEVIGIHPHPTHSFGKLGFERDVFNDY